MCLSVIVVSLLNAAVDAWPIIMLIAKALATALIQLNSSLMLLIASLMMGIYHWPKKD